MGFLQLFLPTLTTGLDAERDCTSATDGEVDCSLQVPGWPSRFANVNVCKLMPILLATMKINMSRPDYQLSALD
jgi:hypothetical protein